MFYNNVEQESLRICLPAPKPWFPLDAERTLNVHNTSYVGSIYVMCPEGYDNLGIYNVLIQV